MPLPPGFSWTQEKYNQYTPPSREEIEVDREDFQASEQLFEEWDWQNEQNLGPNGEALPELAQHLVKASVPKRQSLPIKGGKAHRPRQGPRGPPRQRSHGHTAGGGSRADAIGHGVRIGPRASPGARARHLAGGPAPARRLPAPP